MIIEGIMEALINANSNLLINGNQFDSRIIKIKKEMLDFYSKTPIENEYRSTYTNVFYM